MNPAYNGCVCFCHFTHNVMHCFPCCGPGSLRPSEYVRTENRDLDNPRLEALGYKWKRRDGEIILVNIK